MALTVTAAANKNSLYNPYIYLYEPYEVDVISNSGLPDILKITVSERALSNKWTTVNTYTDYALYDLIPYKSVRVNIAEIIKSLFDSNAYDIGNLSDLIPTPEGRNTTMTNYTYQIFFNTNHDSLIGLFFYPLLGARPFKELGALNENIPLEESTALGLPIKEFAYLPNIEINLKPISNTDMTPLTTIYYNNLGEGKKYSGAGLIWKSKYGGWVTWGFDIVSEDFSNSYKGDIKVNPYEINSEGEFYVEPDYSTVETSSTVSLRALSVTKEYAEVLKGINYSPAIYLVRKGVDDSLLATGALELMRLAGAAIPITSLNDGVDVSINLKSISTVTQNVR